MSPRTTRLGAAAVALLLVAGACGGESKSDELTTALTDSLLQDQTFADYEITEPEARCAAERVVDDLVVPTAWSRSASPTTRPRSSSPSSTSRRSPCSPTP